VDDLIAFLRARLNEDEELAQECPPNFNIAESPEREGMFEIRAHAPEAPGRFDDLGEFQYPYAQYIARHDPARVLADVDAKRQIIEEHTDLDGAICPTCTEQDTYRTPQAEPCRTLRLLALPYAGHPAYREGWRP
jgi:hypothetical protein